MSRRLMLRNESGGSTPILPPEYQQVEYIRLPNDFAKAYIVTEVITKTALKIEMGLSSGISNNTIVFLSTTGTSFDSPYCGFSTTNSSLWYPKFSTRAVATIYGYDWSAQRDYGWTGENNKLFRIGTWSDNNFGESFSYYYVRLINYNDELMFNGVPCYEKATNKVGVYDTIGKKFYSSNGELEFLKGANV